MGLAAVLKPAVKAAGIDLTLKMHRRADTVVGVLRARLGHKVPTQSTFGSDGKSRPSELLPGMHRAWMSVRAWPPRPARDRAVTSVGKMHRRSRWLVCVAPLLCLASMLSSLLSQARGTIRVPFPPQGVSVGFRQRCFEHLLCVLLSLCFYVLGAFLPSLRVRARHAHPGIKTCPHGHGPRPVHGVPVPVSMLYRYFGSRHSR